MKRVTFLRLFLFCSLLNYGQTENRFQPASIYKEKKVKKIYVYLNSPKDLSEIIELDKNGKKKLIQKYDASYNVRTRKLKNLAITTHYIYDSIGNLTQKIDTKIYFKNNSNSKSITTYHYEDGLLVLSKYYRNNSDKPSYKTFYSYNPLTTKSITKNDTLITFENTKIFEKNFYVKRSYSFYLEPKLKKGRFNIDDQNIITSFSDPNDIELFNDDKNILNIFNEKEQLIKSEVKSVFRNDRTNNYTLDYKYYRNGLLKSIRGYEKIYFKYEYF